MKQNKKAVCTVSLIVINIGIFLVSMLLDHTKYAGLLMGYGAMYGPYVTQGHEYHRLITSIFLHFGIDHLLNNMVMLGALGWTLELETGKIRFLLIYFFSGIGGNILSFLMNQVYGNKVISAGASGAIFGLMGALVFAVIRSKGNLGRLNKRSIFFMVILSLYLGIVDTGVDNVAHIGGLVCGFIAEAILEVLWKR